MFFITDPNVIQELAGFIEDTDDLKTKWDACREYRVSLLNKKGAEQITTADYFTQFQYLRQPLGYELVSIQFNKKLSFFINNYFF